ncbi:OmpH family outer membrane protein [Qipengyuania sp. JC766]|uniref:OmpH family outer membrane protein n=1 Tax=Qipengyuania sp. JC766 TaxID=3232139 RepID=UPI0034573EBB
MKFSKKTVLAAGIAMAATATVAAPAAAQVNGIAYTSPEAVYLNSSARQAAYAEIANTYATQLQQIETLQQEADTLIASADANGDGNTTNEEIAANASVRTQLEQKQQQLAQASTPIAIARYFVVEQLMNNYDAVEQQVVSANNVQFIFNPDVFQYAPPAANITEKMITQFNASVPSVSATPPANYQPRRTAITMHDTLQQLLLYRAQAAAYQQQQQGAQQAAQPAQQPTGR